MNILNWILKSSADPTKLSLTLKGVFGFGVSALAVFGVGLSLDDVNGFADSLASVVANIGLLVSSAVTLVGFVRKIVNSFRKPQE